MAVPENVVWRPDPFWFPVCAPAQKPLHHFRTVSMWPHLESKKGAADPDDFWPDLVPDHDPYKFSVSATKDSDTDQVLNISSFLCFVFHEKMLWATPCWLLMTSKLFPKFSWKTKSWLLNSANWCSASSLAFPLKWIL
jgi:hypothetical protein